MRPIPAPRWGRVRPTSCICCWIFPDSGRILRRCGRFRPNLVRHRTQGANFGAQWTLRLAELDVISGDLWTDIGQTWTDLAEFDFVGFRPRLGRGRPEFARPSPMLRRSGLLGARLASKSAWRHCAHMCARAQLAIGIISISIAILLSWRCLPRSIGAADSYLPVPHPVERTP